MTPVRLRESPDRFTLAGKEYIFYNHESISFSMTRTGSAYIISTRPDQGHGRLFNKVNVELYAKDPVAAYQVEEEEGFMAVPMNKPDELAKCFDYHLAFHGRLFLKQKIIAFWDSVTLIFPNLTPHITRMIKSIGENPESYKVEVYDADGLPYKVRSEYGSKSDGNDKRTIFVPFGNIESCAIDLELYNGGTATTNDMADRHLAAATGDDFGVDYDLLRGHRRFDRNMLSPKKKVSNTGFGSRYQQDIAKAHDFPTVAQMHASKEEESISRKILGTVCN